MIEGQLHHFSAGGLFNGLVLLIDDESKTYWDHITGEALHGPLKGKRLDAWPVDMTTVAAALEADPGITLHRRPVHTFARFFGFLHRNSFRHGGFLPPRFRGTMGPEDKRLDRMSHGLGVVVGDEARFFPMQDVQAGISFEWDGRRMGLTISGQNRVPTAAWEDGERPFQLFTRWYGFSYTYPGCSIWDGG